MNNVHDEWCVWNDCKRNPVDGQCWEGDDCPECWDGITSGVSWMNIAKPEVTMNVRLVNRKAYLFKAIADAIGEWPRAHKMRTLGEDWQHCPSCDKHVPAINDWGNVKDLVEDPEDCWHLSDGSIAEEDGHGGLMVQKCKDCVLNMNDLL
jgi:hypothetical protein